MTLQPKLVRVDRYEAHDGTQFETPEEALHHNLCAAVYEQLDDVIVYGDFRGIESAAEFIEVIRNHSDLIHKILDHGEEK